MGWRSINMAEGETMSWRTQLSQCIYNTGHTDIYEFGVYSGESVWDIKNIYDQANIPVRKFFCFDSFVGLPEETAEPIAQPDWHEGAFNACKKFGVNTVNECINVVDREIHKHANFEETPIVYVPGFFEDVLTDNLAKELDMRPAAFIDMDADIYSSTYTALDFMFRNNLVKRGTFIAYDDWGGTPGWQTCADGESRAHNEICNKYRVNIQLVAQFGMTYPHVQTVFMVMA